VELEKKSFFDFVRLLHQWISDLHDVPAVFWYINSANNKITFFNNNDSNSFNTNVSLLLQNQEYARTIVLSEDFEVFSHALQCAKNQHPTSVVFRIHGEDGETRWIVLLGLAAPDASVLLLVIVVQIFQEIGMKLAKKFDQRK